MQFHLPSAQILLGEWETKDNKGVRTVGAPAAFLTFLMSMLFLLQTAQDRHSKH